MSHDHDHNMHQGHMNPDHHDMANPTHQMPHYDENVSTLTTYLDLYVFEIIYLSICCCLLALSLLCT